MPAVPAPVRISAVSQFVPDHSDPKNGRYFFAYRVTIENRGAAPVQLISRHWVITDANHKIEEVRGETGEFDAEIPQFILSCDNTVN